MVRPRLHLSILSALAVLMSFGPGTTAATARELADAPLVQAIGFSADGRYFAFEQYENDVVAADVFAAIDVIDRTTNQSAKGFPLGFLGMQVDGVFPLPVGPKRIGRPDQNLEGAARLELLRRAVREGAQPQLDAIGIVNRGVVKNGIVNDGLDRLAGQPLTERSPDGPRPLLFVTSPTLPGAVPDRQPLYRVTTRIVPDDANECTPPAARHDHAIHIDVTALDPLTGDRHGTPSTLEVAWPLGDNECAGSVQLTDVYAAPSGSDEKETFVVIVMLAISHGPHSESGRYFATFAKLP